MFPRVPLCYLARRVRFTATFTLSATSQPARRSFRSCANRPILALVPKTSPGVINAVTPSAWILEHELIGSEAVSAIIAQATAPQCLRIGQKVHGERASKRTKERTNASLFYRSNYRGDWSIGLALVTQLRRTREPRCNFVMKRETADENPSFDCCTFPHRVTYQGQGPWILRRTWTVDVRAASETTRARVLYSSGK